MAPDDGWRSPSFARRLRLAAFILLAATAAPTILPAAAGPSAEPLLVPAAPVAPPSHLRLERWRAVTVRAEALERSRDGGRLDIELFGGERLTATHRRTVFNRSGSRSWIGEIGRQDPVVLVHREGVTIGSIRRGGEVYMLAYSGTGDAHVLYEVDLTLPKYREMEPMPAAVDAERLADARRTEARRQAGAEPADDGSIQDLMVVYTALARDEVGGQVAIENLIDLGVTETNLSYEASGIDHRLRLVHTLLTDFDETLGLGCPRTLLQDPDDGVMDEVHPVRDRVAADMVKLIFDGNGCGFAYIMDEVSTAHAEFAFAITNHVCVSPGYTFQHELGHIQAARHQRSSPQPDSPFPFNFGYVDVENRFRTIMAAGSQDCPDGCPRRLAWSNPDVLDDETGAPMGVPEGEELPADNRKTLNATAWVVANFRVSGSAVFADGFESGDTTAWSSVAPP